MSENSNSTTLPTARKSRRASRRKRPVLVSGTTQDTQGFQESQSEIPEPEIGNARVRTEPLGKVSATTETPAKARRVSRLPSFFSKVEKTVEEPETSQSEVVKARLARAQKTTPKTEPTPTASETKETHEKPARGANHTATTTRPNKLFKTRHLIGMMVYLFGAEALLLPEREFLRQRGLEQVLTQFNLFNIPIVITTSVLANLATLIIFLVILVKLDLLPSSLGSKAAAAARARKQQREQSATAERPPQQTVRQGVKGEHDDLYYAYRTNQRKEKKH